MMSSDEQTPSRPSISTVDARVGRLEDAQQVLASRQAELDAVVRLIQSEQVHIREIMTSRFGTIESQLNLQGSKMDNFIGRMETLIQKGMEQQADLEASPLGRQIHERLQRVEADQQVSREFRAEVRGMTGTMRVLTGGSVAGFLLALAALGKAMGVL